MPVVPINKTSIPHDSGGINLTDATFTTMTAGAGNGAQYTWATNDIVVLKNDTGGAAVFTLKLSAAAKAQATAYGATTPDPTNSVAAGKTDLMRLDLDAFKDTDGKVTIECDIAGKILVLAPG